MNYKPWEVLARQSWLLFFLTAKQLPPRPFLQAFDRESSGEFTETESGELRGSRTLLAGHPK